MDNAMAESDPSRLRDCLNDIISLVALPSMSVGVDLPDIADRLVEALLAMLHADFVILTIGVISSGGVRSAHFSPCIKPARRQEIANDLLCASEAAVYPVRWQFTLEETEFHATAFSFGVASLTGALVAGSRDSDFPNEQQRLLLNIAANHAALAAQEAASRRALEMTVAARTSELEATNLRLVREINDRQRADQDLRKSEAFLAQAQRLTMTGSIWWRPFSGEMFWSAEAFRLFEYSLNEVPSIDLLVARCHPDELDKLHAVLAELMAEGSSVDFEYRLRMRDGRIKHLHAVLQNVGINKGAGEIFGAITDITDRKAAEDRLRKSEMLLLAGQKMSQTGTFSWWLDTDEVTGSEEWYRILGFDGANRVRLRDIAKRIHPDDLQAFHLAIEDAKEGKDGSEHQVRLLFDGALIKYLRSFSRIIEHKDGRVECIGAIQDITQRHLAEDARDKFRSELSHVTRSISLGELAASIAHEVNQPLSGIMTNANTCLRLLSAEPPNLPVALETVRRTLRDSQRAADVITRLRALFRRNATVFEPVDLNAAARQVIGLLASDFQRRRITVRIEMADDLPPTEGDRVQLQQVILNLLRNAADAIDEGVDQEREIVLRTSAAAGGSVQLAVQDTGCGIDLDNIEELFQAFRSTKTEGLGVGLSVSRSIVESHKGRIWAERRAGRTGASFCVALPCYNQDHKSGVAATMPPSGDTTR